MTLRPVDVEGLREMLAAATPGPWEPSSGWHEDEHGFAGCGPLASNDDQAEHDGAIIAAAVNSLGPLLDELTRLRAECVECKRLLLRRVEASRLDAAEAEVARLRAALRRAEPWFDAMVCDVADQCRKELGSEPAGGDHASENDARGEYALSAATFGRMVSDAKKERDAARDELQVWKDRAEGRLARIEALEPGGAHLPAKAK